MNKKVAENILNLVVSDRFTFKGSELGAIMEIVRSLQEVINNGGAEDSQGGASETPPAPES